MSVAAERMTVKRVKARRHSRSSTMAANFHSDSNLAVAASALILSAMTVISILMPWSSFSSPEGSSSCSSSGESKDLSWGLAGSRTDSLAA